MADRPTIAVPVILVVEDSPDDAMIVGLTFQETGIVNPLIFVEDGEEAIDYMLRRNKYADASKWPLPLLVILDLNLPRYDGFEVLAATERIRNENDIPVVVLSVSDSDEDRDRAVQMGATKVLRKPIDPGMLLQLISEITDLSLMLVPASLQG